MAQTSGLTVRQHQRNTLGLRVDFVVGDSHREQVRFSTMSTAAEPHVTTGLATDVSTGGLGIICGQFVPRMCEGTVRVYHPESVGVGSDGSPIHEVTFEHPVKVRRVTLGSHDPTYSLGLAFIDSVPNIEKHVAELLALAQTTAESDDDAQGSADG